MAMGVLSRWEFWEAPNCKDSSAGQLRPVGWLQANDFEQGFKDGWGCRPPHIPIVSWQQDKLDLLDLEEQPNTLS